MSVDKYKIDRIYFHEINLFDQSKGVLKSSSEFEKKKIITHAWEIIFQYFMYLKSNLRSLLYRENDKRN